MLVNIKKQGNAMNLRNCGLFFLILGQLASNAYASKPLWIFLPLTPTTVSVPQNQTVNVQYLVSNQSSLAHTLVMQPIAGVTQITGSGLCSSDLTLASKGSCTLSLAVDGALVASGNTKGPVLCEQGTQLQCYRPASINTLNISVTPSVCSVGGTVSGYGSSSALVLETNTQSIAMQQQAITGNGPFAFSQLLISGDTYNVTVVTQPTGQTCTVTNGSGTIAAANVTNVAVSCSAFLTTSVDNLALSVNNPSTAALTGTSRKIIITNVGAFAATGLSIAYPTWPSGTTASTTCPIGGSLGAGSTCTITVTPGSTATSSCNTGVAPTPGQIVVSAANVDAPVTSNVFVLDYGCQYQGGYLYSVDDTTPNNGSIGGKVVALQDQAAPKLPSGSQATSIIWSSNNAATGGVTYSYDYIPYISETAGVPNYNDSQEYYNATYSNSSVYQFPPSNVFATCNSLVDGQCNSNNILAFYNTYRTNYGLGVGTTYEVSLGETTQSYYAAGLCNSYSANGYSDWYLPAICEMSPAGSNASCAYGTQNITTNLGILVGQAYATDPSTSCAVGANCLVGYYWSSNIYSVFESAYAWFMFFDGSSNSNDCTYKSVLLGVRCARALSQ